MRIIATAPLDLAPMGLEVAGYIALAALSGVAIWQTLLTVRIIVRAFKSTGDNPNKF